ncbi:MAG: HipA N-terminal domain-containing protein [Gammaproteobacteria bacterium]|nr:HipA N-terminal domain-containing protein [Gammaproteobacteria bacterium]MDE0040140.1 HipA N-terminal domain-containing protein [Gammaproteobacteria bacterium]MDE0442066.1 HipA N-terminal domain-containing protein [Gammaproteobacteria bacterium]
MRRATVFVAGEPAGLLEEHESSRFLFRYLDGYTGPAVSLTMPVSAGTIWFDAFPPFFEGLLPEGVMLDGLLRQRKIDRNDLFGQLLAVGEDVVGAVTVREQLS